MTQLIGQYPTPPPVATGPGLDRPLFSVGTTPSPDYGGGGVPNEGSSNGYTMARTRKFYQDQIESANNPPQRRISADAFGYV